MRGCEYWPEVSDPLALFTAWGAPCALLRAVRGPVALVLASNRLIVITHGSVHVTGKRFDLTFNCDNEGSEPLSQETIERIGDKIVDVLKRAGITTASISITY